jgi:hypothetical protein
MVLDVTLPAWSCVALLLVQQKLALISPYGSRMVLANGRRRLTLAQCYHPFLIKEMELRQKKIKEMEPKLRPTHVRPRMVRRCTPRAHMRDTSRARAPTGHRSIPWVMTLSAILLRLICVVNFQGQIFLNFWTMAA